MRLTTLSRFFLNTDQSGYSFTRNVIMCHIIFFPFFLPSSWHEEGIIVNIESASATGIVVSNRVRP